MRVIARTHASTRSTALMRVKNSTHHFYLWHFKKNSNRLTQLKFNRFLRILRKSYFEIKSKIKTCTQTFCCFCKPIFSFRFAYLLKIIEVDFDNLNIGLYLSKGGDEMQWDLLSFNENIFNYKPHIPSFSKFLN